MKFYINRFLGNIKKTELTEALETCAKKHGYRVEYISNPVQHPTANDVLVIWNRHINQHDMAIKFEKAGAKVIMFENPYIKLDGNFWYSVALKYHNNIKHSLPKLDSGERWESFNKEILPWRESGNHILIATQAKRFNNAGIGYELSKQPIGWDLNIIKKIRKHTATRDILFRQHPNGFEFEGFKSYQRVIKNLYHSNGKTPIEKDLQNAWCTVVHTSNSATNSLLAGVPVMLCGPNLFLKDACSPGIMHLNNPIMPDNRLELFERMAWNQFNIEEIASGFLLDLILDKTIKS